MPTTKQTTGYVCSLATFSLCAAVFLFISSVTRFFHVFIYACVFSRRSHIFAPCRRVRILEFNNRDESSNVLAWKFSISKQVYFDVPRAIYDCFEWFLASNRGVDHWNCMPAHSEPWHEYLVHFRGDSTSIGIPGTCGRGGAYLLVKSSILLSCFFFSLLSLLLLNEWLIV